MNGSPAIVKSERERWLDERRRLIGASDVPAILGEDDRRGPLAVWAAKVSDIETEETVPMRRGRRFEDAIAREYGDELGRPVSSPGEFHITRHRSIPWLGCTLDRVTDGTPARPDPLGGTGSRLGAPLQIKLALGSARDWSDGAPLPFVIQVQVEMACYDSKWGALAALVGPGPLATTDIVRDDGFLEALVSQLERFWWHVEKRIPPEADAKPGTSAAVRRLWSGEDGTTVPLDAEAEELVSAWESAKERCHAADFTAELLENKLRARLQGASFGALPDGRFVTLRQVEREGYTVGPAKFRVLRVMRTKRRRF